MLQDREIDDGPGPVVRAVAIVERKGVTKITSPQLNLVYKVIDEFAPGLGSNSSGNVHYVARTMKFCDCDRFFRNVLVISPPLHVCEHILAVHLATSAVLGPHDQYMNQVSMDNAAVVDMIFEMFSGGDYDR